VFSIDCSFGNVIIPQYQQNKGVQTKLKKLLENF
jgi:hypothetical protein